MSKINAGDIPVVLNGEERVLRPTLKAITQISQRYSGLGKARDNLVVQDFDTVVFVLRQGLNLSDADFKGFPEKVYQNGLDAELIVPLIRYVAVLANGGKPLPDDPVDQDGGDGEGAQGNG